MLKILTTRTGAASAERRRRSSITRFVGTLLLVIASRGFCHAQHTLDFHRILAVENAEPVVLSVEITSGELEILYSRDGQVSIGAFAESLGDYKLDDKYFPTVFTVEQAGNHVTIRHVASPAYAEEKIKTVYRIDVPYRTQVTSKVNRGRQSISGILGPVESTTGKGDVRVSYVSRTVDARVEYGNLDLSVIGEHVDAKVGNGNISGQRLPEGIRAETGEGDITLTVVGPTTATVEQGDGRIEVGGARGTLTSSTDRGGIRIVALPHDDWKLNSASGAIRLELPPAAHFDLEASTDDGHIQSERDDMPEPNSDFHHVSQKVNGGGKRIQVHTGNGRILIR